MTGATGDTPGPTFLVTYDFPPLAGSIARSLGEVARFWPPGDLVVSTGHASAAEASDARLPVRVDRLPVPSRRLRTLPGLLFWSRRVVGLARRLEPSFIWCGNLQPAAYPAKWARERVGVPYGIMVHGADLLTLQHRLHQSRVRRRPLRSLVGSASVIVANTRWTRERCDLLLGELGIDPALDRIRVVLPGADPQRFRPGLETTELRRRYGIPGGRWLLTVASLTPSEGVDVTLRALALLAPDFEDLGYLVVGAASEHESWTETARDLGVADRVRLLPELSEDDRSALHNLAEVYVGVSPQAGLDVEGSALVSLEASASGVPVVAGRGGGMADVVREGETGFLVDSESPDAVAGALRNLLTDPGLARRLGQEGRRTVEQGLNWQRVVAELRAISSAFRLERSPAPRL